MTNSVLDAFLSQTYSKYGGVDNYERYCAEVLAKKEEAHEGYVKEAMLKLNSDQTISNYIDVPSKLKESDINSVTEPSPFLKNYDHSLESNRLHSLLLKYDSSMEEICCNDDISEVQLTPEIISKEDISNTPAPDLSGLFDNVFN